MRNKLSALALLCAILIPFARPWEGVPSLVGNRAKGTLSGTVPTAQKMASVGTVPSFMPVFGLDLSDLDARDSKNRLIKDSQRRGELQALFVDNLFNLTVLFDLHGMRAICSDMQLFLNLFHDTIFNCSRVVLGAIQEALQPPEKRFVHNGDNLWMVFSVGIFPAGYLLSRLHPQTPASFMMLRC